MHADAAKNNAKTEQMDFITHMFIFLISDFCFKNMFVRIEFLFLILM